ncbi:MAG: TlpA family protein disulfide reductase [Thaumarchaeota archaeon]|nr:TlpA family protein disulfide reductase [Nitrososphaerota archaeon]
MTGVISQRRRFIYLVFLIALSTGLFASNSQFFLRSSFNPILAVNWIPFGAATEEKIRAPNFCLTDIEGSQFCLEEFRGRVVLIDLMATWCIACEDQALQLKDVYEKYSSKGVVFISVSVDVGEYPRDVKGFRDYIGAEWRFAIDTLTTRVGLKYESKYLPTLYLVDKNGFIVWSEKGVTDAATLSKLLDKYV